MRHNNHRTRIQADSSDFRAEGKQVYILVETCLYGRF